MTKDEYVEMLYDRAEYLKSEIADFEKCNGGVEQARLWEIKEQVSCLFGLIKECDIELFPDTVRCDQTEQEYIQTCTTEQLAKVIINIAFSEGFDSVRFKCGTNNYCSSSRVHPYKNAEKIVINEWLKQPHHTRSRE